MDVIFQEHPEVEIATNKFIGVPTIIQWEDTPLIEVGKFEPAGYTTRFTVYHNDGTPIAVVRGSRIIRTDEGKRAKIEQRTAPDLTALELEGKTIIEMRRKGAAALKGWAEIYAPEGVFIKANDTDMAAILGNGTGIPVLSGIRNGVFKEHLIAIHVTKNGIAFGGKGGKGMYFEFGGAEGTTWASRATGGGGVGILPGDSVSLRPDPGGEAFVNTHTPSGFIVRGAVGAPKSHDAPPSDDAPSE
jgi:hypothetical protein